MGTPFTWKLTAGAPGATDVRWETGEDRSARAVTEPLVPSDEVVLAGSWQ